MRAILADTGPLYAAIDAGDQYHNRAQKELQRISAEKLTVIVSFPVLLETSNLLLYRLGIQQATNFVNQCRSSTQLTNPSQEQYLLAANRVAQFPNQQITICDAVTALLSEQIGCSIWTYDYHFDVLQASVWR